MAKRGLNQEERARGYGDTNSAVALQRLLDQLEVASADNFDDWIVLRDVRLCAPTEEKPEWFVVVRGWTNDGAVVGFTSAPRLEDAIRLTGTRLLNKSMKLQREKPYERK